MPSLSQASSCLALAIALLSQPASAASLTFSGAGGALPDFDAINGVPGEVSFVITVPEPGVVSGAIDNIHVRLIGFQHTFASDLEVILTHEASGVSRSLFSQIGLPGTAASSNFNDNYDFCGCNTGDLWTTALGLGDVDDIPGESAGLLYYPTNAGSNAPNDFSAAFRGLLAPGQWRLTIRDFAAGDIGDLLAWDLALDVVNTVPEPATQLLVLAGAGVFLLRLCSKSRPAR
ncbi:MAG: PEP-CTERM sorting domain-containing protein [Acidobacteria bacterium]|nr:PEP-CTERM sorting domain-containing protein [Acidobacteriota bacterium]